MGVTKPYKFIKFGAMDVTKPYPTTLYQKPWRNLGGATGAGESIRKSGCVLRLLVQDRCPNAEHYETAR